MEKVDILHKKADIINKKALILLVSAGGIGSFATTQDGWSEVTLFVIFTFLSLGVMINYFELNKTKKEIERIENE